MHQQVNLLQRRLGESHRAIAASTVALATGLFVCGLVGTWGYGSWEVSRLAHAVEAMHVRQQTQLAMLSTVGATQGSQTPVDVEARVKALNAELTARTQALELIKAGAVGRRTGFAARLEALSRRHVEGIWLDRLSLAGAGQTMNLSGATLDANLVPRYLQSLAADPALTGTRFDELVIEQPAASDSPAAAPRALRFHAGKSSQKPREHS